MKLNLDEALGLETEVLNEEEIKGQTDLFTHEAEKKAEELYNKIKSKDSFEDWFEVLVPASGKADTKAGELLRAMGRIIYRDFNDGDKFFSGYGVETCGGSAQYLMDNTPYEISEKLADMANDPFSYIFAPNGNEKYTEDIGVLSIDLINYLNKHKELIAEENEVDSREMDLDPDLITKFSFECELPPQLRQLIEDGKYSEEDLEEEVSNWDVAGNLGMYSDELRVSAGTLYIEGLEEDAYNELERNAYRWLEQLADEIESDGIEESLKEPVEESVEKKAYVVEIGEADNAGYERHKKVFSTLSEAQKYFDESWNRLVAETVENNALTYREALHYREEVEETRGQASCDDSIADPDGEWYVHLESAEIEESLREGFEDMYIYLFPELEEKDKEALEEYNLKFMGKNHFEDEISDVVEGRKDDLKLYAKEYLDYVLHPDYLYKSDEFAGNIEPVEKESFDSLDEELIEDVTYDVLTDDTLEDICESKESDKLIKDAKHVIDKLEDIGEASLEVEDVGALKKLKGDIEKVLKKDSETKKEIKEELEDLETYTVLHLLDSYKVDVIQYSNDREADAAIEELHEMSDEQLLDELDIIGYAQLEPNGDVRDMYISTYADYARALSALNGEEEEPYIDIEDNSIEEKLEIEKDPKVKKEIEKEIEEVEAAIDYADDHNQPAQAIELHNELDKLQESNEDDEPVIDYVNENISNQAQESKKVDLNEVK